MNLSVFFVLVTFDVTVITKIISICVLHACPSRMTSKAFFVFHDNRTHFPNVILHILLSSSVFFYTLVMCKYSGVLMKKKRNRREWKKRKMRVYKRTTRERNVMYECMSKEVREKILLLRLY
jgi:hypothetical protein